MINTQIDPKELIAKSVTKDDKSEYAGGGVIRYFMPINYGGTGADSVGALPPVLPPYWSFERDRILRDTVHKESMWSAAIGIAISKVAASAWQVTSEVPLRARRGQDILLNADGVTVGWTSFAAKDLRDFLTTDNGSFTEIVRARKSRYSRPIGLRHLDSRRCIRTGDPNTPVIYRDRRGRWHGLPWYSVIALSDLPDPSDFYYGVGLCSASRAYTQIYKLAGMDWYMNEKIRGMRPLAIHIVNGVLDRQMKNAVEAAKEGVNARGLTSFMGAVVMGIPQGESPGLVTIPLAEIPDGFNRKEELDNGMLAYANAIGLDPQDLQPLTSSQLGTGTQAAVLHEKAKGRGLVTWKQGWTHAYNELVLPKATTFVFIENDFDDRIKKAKIANEFTEASAKRIEKGMTSAAQEVSVLVDEGVLPKEYEDVNLTPTTTLDDGEKPVESEARNSEADKSEAEQLKLTDAERNMRTRAEEAGADRVYEDKVKEADERPLCVVCGKPVDIGFHVIYAKEKGVACKTHESATVLRLKQFTYEAPETPLFDREYENARILFEMAKESDYARIA